MTKNTCFKKSQHLGHCSKVSFHCNILQSFCFSLSSSKKAYASCKANETTYRLQGKANSTNVILQSEKEGQIYL